VPHQTATTLVIGDLVLDDRIVQGGGVLIEGGKIASVHESPRNIEAGETVDFSGCLVMPGIVDSHIHARSSELEGLTKATSAAATGGVTTVIDMPFDHPNPITELDRFEQKAADISREAVVDVGLYATMPKHDGVDRLRELAKAGACAFKFSMFEVDPERLPRIGNGDLLMAFEELAPMRVPVVVHAEDQEIVSAMLGRARIRDIADWTRHSLSRPVVAETAALAVLLELAYWTHARLHVAHVTHPHGFDIIDLYRSLGADVTGETCVQYMTLTDEDTAQRFGPMAKINPPLRDATARDGLWTALSEGRVASISSDHAPWPRSRKQPPMLQAASGMPGLETLVPALFRIQTPSAGLAVCGRILDLAAGPNLWRGRPEGSVALGYGCGPMCVRPENRLAL
jgi:allantoinase